MLTKSNIWHPCTQMKEHEVYPPLKVSKGTGSYLYTNQNNKVIDAISSWWCKNLGHNNPRVKQAIISQLDYLDHSMLSSTTNETIELLSKKLTSLYDGLDKIFYAGGDGSSAVEVSLKLSLHARKILGEEHKNSFISLSNSYHGDTCGAMSVSNNETINNTPYNEIMFNCYHINNIPYVSGSNDPLWSNCDEYWSKIEPELNKRAYSTNAIILEPIVQGAGNMKIYSKDFLKRLSGWAKKNDIFIIADEIMTGIGRTGKMFACQHANIFPDFLCIGKGITSGALPMSMVLTNKKIYDVFYNDKSFLHSHTFAGNTLAAAAASAVIDIMNKDNIVSYVNNIMGPYLYEKFSEIANDLGFISNIRSIGGIVAGDIEVKDQKNFSNRLSFEAQKRGALLRPLGNTIYWLPPLNCELQTISDLAKITHESLVNVTSRIK